MPEYLTPGVYVEETSFRARSIEGVSTTTTAFVGPTRKGPFGVTPELLTSFNDFERIYGGFEDINEKINYMAHAVRAFFDNGGLRLYVSRVVATDQDEEPVGESAISVDLVDGDPSFQFVARFPGEGGNGIVEVFEIATPASQNTLASAPLGSLLRIEQGDTFDFFVKQRDTSSLGDWEDDGAASLAEGDLTGAELDIITLSVLMEVDGNTTTYDDLGLAENHPRWISTVLAQEPTREIDKLNNAIAVDLGQELEPPLPQPTPFILRTSLAPTLNSDRRLVTLTGGTSGGEPRVDDYRNALEQLEAIEDISIVAAPGYSASPNSNAIQDLLITHVSRRRAYEIAVLDAPRNVRPSQARTLRNRIDSDRAALYYPWVKIANPRAQPGRADIPSEINVPPSGFICGIYARNDIERGVYKAPANEVVRGALRFEFEINFAQQSTLNPQGINCLRFFPGRGYRVWGARLAGSNSEIKYVSDRRYLNFLERSIDEGTQFAVFEPNGPQLWTNIRDTISAFLYNEWFSGALFGTSPQEAFFVRCDRSTMTQNDLDNGRLICLVGVALLKPAEFVIFRIGQTLAPI